MANVLSIARSFGKLLPIGKDILESNGHKLFFVPEDYYPLDENRILQLINRFSIIAIVVGAEKITSKVLGSGNSIRIVAKHGAGLDNIDVDYATKKHIAVTYTPEANTQAVAELTIALILCMARRIPQAYDSMKMGNWKTFMGDEIFGKTIGVVGTGKIGKEVIRKLSGMNTNILAYDIIKSEEIESLQNVTYVGLEKLFTYSDFITLHVPLTEATSKFIGKRELKLMKKSAFLINASRGGVVDEAALYEFLKANKICGAALDVWENEPPRSISAELVKLDNVIPTPHIGAYTREAVYRMGDECARSIVDFFNKKKPRFLANPEVWRNIEDK